MILSWGDFRSGGGPGAWARKDVGMSVHRERGAHRPEKRERHLRGGHEEDSELRKSQLLLFRGGVRASEKGGREESELVGPDVKVGIFNSAGWETDQREGTRGLGAGPLCAERVEDAQWQPELRAHSASKTTSMTFTSAFHRTSERCLGVLISTPQLLWGEN